MKRRFILSLLVAVLAFTVSFLLDTEDSVLAAEADTWDGTVADSYAGGSGTEEDPYIIATAEQLAKLAADVNGGNPYKESYFELTADLDLSGHNWTPIGSNEGTADANVRNGNPFSGRFDGGYHTISNLTISTDKNYQGLFGYLRSNRSENDPCISRLILINPNIQHTGSESEGIGSLAGVLDFAAVVNCAVEGGSVSGHNGVGGLVGTAISGQNSKIFSCYNAGTTVTGNARVGGVLGGGSSENPELGYVKSCFNTGTVTGKETFGSVFGECNQYNQCVYLEDSCEDGYNYGISCTSEQFRNGYAAGALSYTGWKWEFNWTQDLDQENGGENADPYPTFNSRSILGRPYGVYTGDADTPYKLAYISYNTDKMQTREIDGESYYVITDIYDFVAFINKANSSKNGIGEDELDANAYVEPGTVIDFSVLGTMSRAEYTNATPVHYITVAANDKEEEAYRYNGTFLGNGMRIKGLSFYYDPAAGSSGDYTLFGYVGKNGHVSGITVESPEIYTGRGNAAAGIARENYGTIEDCHVAGGEITALYKTSSSAETTAAGIVACNYGDIKNCSNSADVTAGTMAGGITGYSYVLTVIYDGSSWVQDPNPPSSAEDPNIISGCFNSGNVTARDTQGDAGGIHGGYISYGPLYTPPYVTIENCANTGTVSAPRNNGGIAGNLGSDDTYGSVKNCYNAGTIGGSSAKRAAGISASYGIVENCHNAGQITVNESGYAQPIVGTNSTTPAVSADSYALENCVTGYDGTLYYGPSEELKDQGKVTEDRMASGEIAYLLNGSTSTGDLAWGQTIGTDEYPVFHSSDPINTVWQTEEGDNVTYTNTDPSVARIGENTYLTLNAAFAAAARMTEFNGEPVSTDNPVVIEVLKDITLEEEIYIMDDWHVRLTSAEGGPYTVTRDPAKAPDTMIEMFTAVSYPPRDYNSTLILDNIILDGGATEDSGETDSILLIEGTAIMNDGAVIQNNKGKNNGSAVDVQEGTFIMNNGSVIQNNTTAGSGGAVMTGAEFIMNGGTITGNSSTYHGGGVYFSNSGTKQNVFLYGGTITGNVRKGVSEDSPEDVYTQNGSILVMGGNIQIGYTTFANTSSKIIVSSPLTNSTNLNYALTPANGTVIIEKGENYGEGSLDKSKFVFTGWSSRCLWLSEDGSEITVDAHSGGTNTCTEAAVCASCGTVYGKALGHKWGNPEWIWSEDHSSASAKFTCQNDAGHIETVNAEISSSMTEADCTNDGEVVYTAKVVFNEETYTDVQKVTITATGHITGTEWKSDGTGHWNECTVCGDRLNESSHTYEWVTDKEATETEAGSRHEECSICGYKKAAVEIPAIGTSGTEQKDQTKQDGVVSPKSGDSDSYALWIVLMILACGGVTGTAIHSYKRKTK